MREKKIDYVKPEILDLGPAAAIHGAVCGFPGSMAQTGCTGPGNSALTQCGGGNNPFVGTCQPGDQLDT